MTLHWGNFNTLFWCKNYTIILKVVTSWKFYPIISMYYNYEWLTDQYKWLKKKFQYLKISSTLNGNVWIHQWYLLNCWPKITWKYMHMLIIMCKILFGELKLVLHATERILCDIKMIQCQCCCWTLINSCYYIPVSSKCIDMININVHNSWKNLERIVILEWIYNITMT